MSMIDHFTTVQLKYNIIQITVLPKKIVPYHRRTHAQHYDPHKINYNVQLGK